MSKDAKDKSKSETTAPGQAGTDPAPGSERADRLEEAALQTAMAKKQCPDCAVVGLWKIYSVKGIVRYVTCKACGKHNDKVVPNIEENADAKADKKD